jgi:hypothetical protein
MEYSDQILKKQKYFEKTLSLDAIYLTWLRMLDISPLFSQYAWLQLPVFDLTELGMVLLYSIPPIEFQPLSLSFKCEMPTPEETLQGIWLKLQPIDISTLYKWMINIEEFVKANFKPEFWLQLLLGRLQKAIYGVSPYGRSYYDPIAAREFLRSTFLRLRLLRTPDISWLKEMDEVSKCLGIVDVTDEHVYNRLMMMFSAQTNAFVLGLSILGRSRLTETANGLGIIPFRTAGGEEFELGFRTLDHLQMGLILGVTPLGYGFLMPTDTIYVLPEEKRNPPAIDMIVDKVKGIVDRLPLSTWSYVTYERADEMSDYHRSMKVNQYHALQTQRTFIEEWVAKQIPEEEANPVRIRQYQNAVLQAVAYKVKRHRWGFDGWKAMSEGQFKEWWKLHWSGQNLNISVLEKLYEGMEIWLRNIREERVSLGEKVRKIRRQLAQAL